MLIVLEILVTPPFLTLGAQLQQVGVGTFSLLIIVAETLILVGMYISFALYYFKKFHKFALCEFWAILFH